MKKQLFSFCFALLVCAIGNTQGDQTSINVPINSSGSQTFPALLHLPDDYNSTSTRYPIIVFLHGAGDASSPPNLAKIYNNSNTGGPAYFIARNQWPSSFVNPADGQSYKFIVVSPQANSWSPSSTHLNYILNYLVNTYRVDGTRIYLTGLSAGGEGVVSYTSHLTGSSTFTPLNKPAAIVPMAAAIGTPQQSWGNTTVADNVKVWGFGSVASDIHGENTQKYVQVVNNAGSGYGRFTNYSGGHCCFNTYYNPTYKETINGSSMSIYQWMLQYKQGGGSTPPANQNPVSNAGTDKTITLPTNSVTMSGSGTDPDGSISAYNWTKVSGPTQYNISNANVSNPVISNLVAGTYTFRLRVTDNKGATANDDVNVIVNSAPSNPPSSPKAVPGSIQAEDYSAMSGITTETTSDAGGGVNITSISNGDWMDYYVNVSAAGTYTANFRVSATSTGQKFQVRRSDGTVLLTRSLNSTGGAQTWTTVTSSITLTAGTQTLRIHSLASGWSINYFELLQSGQSNPPAPPPSGSDKYVRVNVYTSTPYNNSQWNNWSVNGGEATNLNSGALKYSDGSNSSVTAVMSYTQSMADNGSSYTGTMAPAEVLRYASYSWKQRTVTLSGLSSSKKYNLEFYASRGSNPGITTTYTINGTNATVSTYNNSTNKASFTNVSPDSQGKIVISLTHSASYNYLNGFTLTELGSGSTSTAGSREAESLKAGNEITVSPDPVTDRFALQVNNNLTGMMNIQITDAEGNVKKEFNIMKSEAGATQVYLTAGELAAGEYFIKVQLDEWTASKKFSKQ